MAENHEKEFKDRTIAECAWLFVREKLFSVPAIILLGCFVLMVVGYFLPAVTDSKFSTIAEKLVWIYGVYAAGGVGVKFASKR